MLHCQKCIKGMYIKEELRRENQGLKVYPVDGSPVISMTGTYFWFVLSMLSGLIKKKRSCAVTPPVLSNNFKIQNPPVVGWRQVLCTTPSPRQSPKENKFKLWLRREFWSVVVSPAGRSQILKSSIPEDSHPNGCGNPVQVTLRLSSLWGGCCTHRMHQSGYHTAAE